MNGKCSVLVVIQDEYLNCQSMVVSDLDGNLQVEETGKGGRPHPLVGRVASALRAGIHRVNPCQAHDAVIVDEVMP